MNPDRFWRSLAVTTAVVSAGLVFLHSGARAVTAEDSGELTAAAAVLGVPHPPGFPLWTVLAHGFTLLGVPATGASLLSALAGCMASGVVVMIGQELGLGSTTSCTAGCLVAFGRTFWSQAVIAEVYTLNCLLFTVQIYGLLRCRSTRRLRWAALTALTFGLACSNHYMLALLVAPGLGAYLFLSARDVDGAIRYSQWLLLGLLAVSPSLLYLYLPWAASSRPLMNWGDPSTWESFWAHVSRKAYRALELGAEPRMLDRVSFLWQMVWLGLEEFSAFVTVPGLLAFCLFRSSIRGAERLLLLGVLFFNGPILLSILQFVFDGENRTRVEEYYLPAWVALALITSAGWAAIIPRSRQALILLLPLLPVGLNYRTNDYSKMDAVDVLNRELLEALPPGAILFASSDFTSFPTVYLQTQGVRNDVLLGDITGDPSAALLKHLEDLGRPYDRDSRMSVVQWTTETSFRPVVITDRSQARGAPVLAWGRGYLIRQGPGATLGWTPEELPSVKQSTAPALAKCPSGECLDVLTRNLLASMLVVEAEHLDQTERPGAEERLEWASDLCSHDTKCLNTVGSVAAELGLGELAETTLMRSVRADPSYSTARRNLVSLYSGRSLAASLRVLRTLLLFRAVPKQEPILDSPATEDVPLEVQLNNLGVTAAKQNRPDEALWWFERSILERPDYRKAWKNLEVLYRDHGENPRTIELVRQLAGQSIDG